jgi:hypothetical protein
MRLIATDRNPAGDPRGRGECADMLGHYLGDRIEA